jgi:signal peptidase
LEKLRQKLKWDTWPEYGKTGFFIVLIVGATLGGYGIFMIGMGTNSPLVVVTSSSMSPTFERGHLLILQSRAPDSIHVGDVVVYNGAWHASAPVVHRVIQIEYVDGEYRYYTQGDANDTPDPGYRLYDDIVGVVVGAVPWIGNITLFLQTPGVLPVVLLLLIVLMILPEFFPKKDEEDIENIGKTESKNDALNV